MRYLVRFDSLGDLNRRLLPSVRTMARSFGLDARNPKWTSYGALELDVFAPTKADLEVFLAATEPLGTIEFVTDLGTAPPHRSDLQLFSEARHLFNSERYWESHEILEGAWRIMRGDEKRYVQGVILVCAAYVRHQKGDDKVALSVLRRARKQLDYRAASFHGIEVDSLRKHTDRIISSGRFEPFRV
jgi:hypothetical protein